MREGRETASHDTAHYRSLVYEKSLTLFRVHDPPFRPIIRNVTLSNQFDFPVVIYSAKLSMKALDYYSVSVSVLFMWCVILSLSLL